MSEIRDFPIGSSVSRNRPLPNFIYLYVLNVRFEPRTCNYAQPKATLSVVLAGVCFAALLSPATRSTESPASSWYTEGGDTWTQ